MSTDNKLLRRPRPYSDESLVGYIVRLADSNYYSSAKYILKFSRLRNTARDSNIFFPQFDNLSVLSYITEVSETSLWSMAFISVNPCKREFIYASVVQAFREKILTTLLHKPGPRLCPVCWKSSPYYRQVWHLSSVTACPFHKCLLIDTCDDCHEPIKFFRSSLLRCKCGFDLRDCEVKNINAEQFALSHQIYKLCQVPNIDSIDYSRELNYLENLENQNDNQPSNYNYELFEGLIAQDTIIPNQIFFPFLGLEQSLNWRRK